MIISALDDRLRRAHQIIAWYNGKAVKPLGGHRYEVVSQSGGQPYQVFVEPDLDPRGQLKNTHCTCPDWEKMSEALVEWPGHPGVPHIDYLPVCKHVLAVMISQDMFDKQWLSSVIEDNRVPATA